MQRTTSSASMVAILTLWLVVAGFGQVPPSTHSGGLAEAYNRWLTDDVRWIITPEEQRIFKSLETDQQRNEFVLAFWEGRNPNPGQQPNKFKEEHYRRIAYADAQFGEMERSQAVMGRMTDRGKYYILYGPPDRITKHPNGDEIWTPESGLERTYPYEDWEYDYLKGIGWFVKIDFVNTGGRYHYTGTSAEQQSK